MSAGKQCILQISPEAGIIGAIAFLTVPLPWLTSAFIAAMIHELSHIAAVKMFGGKLLAFSISTSGAVMRTSPLGLKASTICAIAGPVGSLSLILLIHHLPLIAVCGFIQGLYNLIPICPLDGGKILCFMLQHFNLPHADRITIITEMLVAPILIVVACYLTIAFHFGILPILAACILLLRVFLRKNSLQTASGASTIVLPNNKR